MGKEFRSTRRETFPSGASSTTNATWTNPEANPDLGGEYVK